MMKKRTLKITIIVVVGILVLSWAVWYLGIPEDYIRALVIRNLNEHFRGKRFEINGVVYSVQPEVGRLQKHLLPGLRVKSLLIVANGQKDRIELLDLHDIDITPLVRPLLRGYLRVRLKGRFGREGGFQGYLGARDSQRHAIVDIKGPLSDIRAISALPLKIKGYLRADIMIDTNEITVRFNITQFKGQDLVRENLYLPLSLFKEIKGEVYSNGTTVRITSLSLEGEKIYASFSGQKEGTSLKGLLRIIPERSFPKTLLYAIKRYKKAPELYEVPISIDLKRTGSLPAI